MASYVGYRDGGETNEEGLKKELSRVLTGGFPIVQSATSLQATQRGAGANMSVDLQIGDCMFNYSNGTGYALWGWTDAITNVTVTAADPTNPRIDVVYAYVDLAVVDSTNNNNPGALKFAVIAGTPAGSPTAPNSAAIQAVIGASTPFQKVAQIAVAANATQITDANITDLRQPLAFVGRLWGGSSNTSGHTVPNVADDTVVLANAVQTLNNKTFSNSSFTSPNIQQWGGWQSLSGLFTYAGNNGNKEYLINATGDFTGILSPGMRFQVTRGTTAPTQCMSFTAASSQYAVKTSPSNITFTSNFTTEAWIYVNSYTASSANIISRISGTTGWQFYVKATTGQLGIGYGNAGLRFIESYCTIPLKKWVHVAAAVNVSAGTAAMYINGVSIPNATASGTATTLAQSGNLEVASAGGGFGNFDGYISEGRLWSVAQSQASILANMNISLTGSETNLVGLWQGNGNFNDKTSNANNLTPTNGPNATQAANPMNNIEYAFITNVGSYSGGVTPLTVFTGTDCNIPNMTLSSPQYALGNAYGFPTDKNCWCVYVWFTGINIGAASAASWLKQQITVPTGKWELGYDIQALGILAASGTINARIGLTTTSAGTISTTDPTITKMTAVALSEMYPYLARHVPVTITTPTTYYLNGTPIGTNFTGFGTATDSMNTLTAKLGYI